MPQRGFTLVELLVVISIIALLASLLIPVLSRAKQAAHLAKCRSNVRQIGLAIKMYVDDSECFPAPKYAILTGAIDRHYFWSDQLAPYLKAEWTNEIFRCPSYRGPTLVPRRDNQLWYSRLLGSYGYNGYEAVLGSLYDERKGRSVAESDVLVPSDMIEAGDANIAGKWRASDYIAGSLWSGPEIAWGGYGVLWKNSTNGIRTPPAFGPPEKWIREIQRRHDGKYNALFCDGHIETIPHRTLYSKTDSALRRWNRNHEPIP